MRQALSAAGLDTSGYSGHSFRIGSATSAARVGLEDSLIKSLGRWESSAYQRYIRTLAAVSCQLHVVSIIIDFFVVFCFVCCFVFYVVVLGKFGFMNTEYKVFGLDGCGMWFS